MDQQLYNYDLCSSLDMVYSELVLIMAAEEDIERKCYLDFLCDRLQEAISFIYRKEKEGKRNKRGE